MDASMVKRNEFCVFLQPHQPVQEKKKPFANTAEVDHRSVDDLLTFINGQKLEEERLATKSKAQKRARQKQKKVSVTSNHSCAIPVYCCHVAIPIPGGRESNV